MIDQERFIGEFGPQILHYQAKDADRPERLYERGMLSGGIGWQIPRLPGLGEAPWSLIFAALYRAGFEGDCIIEHEDRDFDGYRRVGQARLPPRPERPATLLRVTSAGRFAEAVALFDGDPRVGAGTGFGGAPGRWVDGRIFAMLVRDEPVAVASRSGHRAGRVGRRNLVRRRQGSADARVGLDPGYIDGGGTSFVAEAFVFVGGGRS